MSVQKNFVVKNGLEVNQKLIVANTNSGKVGIGTSQPTYTLEVAGGIGATHVYAVGFSTVISRFDVGTNGSSLTALGSGGVGVGTNIILSSVALQVNGNQVVTNGKVGIGTTNLTSSLYVVGDTTLGITSATNLTSQNLNVSGVGTIANLSGVGISYTNLNVTGVGTVTNLSGSNLTYSNLSVAGVATIGVLNANTVSISGAAATNFTVLSNLYVGGIGTIGTGIVTNLSGTNINYSGIGTISTLRGTNLNYTGVSTLTNLNGTNLNYTGVSTLTNLSGTNLNYSGISTITNIRSTSINNTGVSTLGTVLISSGIITATSGVVTYYGDGSKLTNIISGVGIATAGGTVGTGATILDFRGSGISTVTVSSGVATINVVGGSGGILDGSVTPAKLSTGGPYWDTNGNLGINTTIPLQPLQVNSGSNVVVIDNLGELGIGLTNPTSKLHLVGNANITGVVTASNFVGSLTGTASTATASATAFGLSGSPNITVGIITSTTLDKSEIKNYTETTSALGNTGTAATINLANGNVFTATLTGNCTFTFTTGVTSGTASFTLILTNDGVAGRTIVWPASVKWPNNVTPSRTTTANATDVWSFFTPNNGTTWYGNIALYNFT